MTGRCPTGQLGILFRNRPIDALVHEVVQVDGAVSHFHHHTNLQKITKTDLSVFFSH